jgi:RodZ C-terminal domain
MEYLRSAALVLFIVAAGVLAGVAALAMTGGLGGASGDLGFSVPRHEATPSQTAAALRRSHRAQTLGALRVFQITAKRGDCWLVLRDTASTGRVLYEGLMAQGRVLTLRRRVIWLSAGAASNLNVLIDGKRVRNLRGTIEAILPVVSRSPAP